MSQPVAARSPNEKQQQQQLTDHHSNSWHLLHYANNRATKHLDTFKHWANVNLDSEWLDAQPLHPHPQPQSNPTPGMADAGHQSEQTLAKLINHDRLAQLSCDSGEMILRLNFSEPFKGIVYPDHNRLSPCRFFGDGHHNYELRLPLRGCGTRQVSPRIFANDVVVRFHKTLELEEDEVKTLICRYPPPLASNPPMVDSATKSATILGINTRLHHHQQQQQPHDPSSQFELVDPLSGRPAAPAILGNTYQQQPAITIEPLDSSPTTGQQAAGSPSLLNGPRGQQQLLASLSAPFGKQRNANIVAPSLPAPSGQPAAKDDDDSALLAINASKGLLDRLSGIELLFLISSLLFLVLLALGLLGSYFCLRHRRRSSASSPSVLSPERAGAILRRKRRYLGAASPSMLVSQPAARSADLAALQHHQQVAFGRLPPTQAMYHRGGHHYQQQHYQHHHLQAPSSPESDVSNQVLLPAQTTGNYSTSRRLNNSFVGPAGKTPNMLDNHYSSHYYATNINNHQAATATANKRQTNDSNLAPVRGRRQADVVIYGPPTLGGRQARRQAAASAGHYHRPPPPATATTTTLGGGHNAASKEPLLVLATGQHPDRLEQADQRDVKGQWFQGQTTTTFDPSIGYHYQPNSSIGRARSMQQLAAIGADGAHPDGWQSLSRRPAAYQRSRPRQMVKQSNIIRPGPLDSSGRHLYDGQASGYAAARQLDQDYCTSSDSEIELNNNNNNGSQNLPAGRGGDHKPKLYLKSIEDSYITNVTEIHEQEYIMKDSTKPLSWAQWRAKQPNKLVPRNGGQDGDHDDDHSDDDDDEDKYQSNQANLRSLTEVDVNFAKSLMRRSSTAKSKTDQSQTAAGGGGVGCDSGQLGDKDLTIESPLTDDNASKRGNSGTRIDRVNLEKEDASKHQDLGGRTSTVDPDIGGHVGKILDKREHHDINNDEDNTISQLNSPDLVISPEYEVGRLKLIGSPTSHDSVSYV